VRGVGLTSEGRRGSGAAPEHTAAELPRRGEGVRVEVRVRVRVRLRLRVRVRVRVRVEVRVRVRAGFGLGDRDPDPNQAGQRRPLLPRRGRQAAAVAPPTAHAARRVRAAGG